MTSLLRRTRDLALHPLWGETRELRARVRCRLALTVPFAVLGGFTWGFFSAPQLGITERLPWSLVGAAGFGLFMYLEQRLFPLVRTLARRLGADVAAPLIWEGLVVGGLFFLLTDVMGAPVVPAVTTAVGLGAAYAWSMEFVLCGEGAGRVMSFLSGTTRGAGPRRPDHSYADSLAARGEIEAAIETHWQSIERDPGDVVPYLRIARLLHREKGRSRDAASVLRRAVRDAEVDERQDAFLVRSLYEACHDSDRGARSAAPDLARYLERRPDGAAADWARRELADIKEELQRDSGPP